MVNTLSEVPNSYGFMGKRAHINYPLYRETAEREKVIGRCFPLLRVSERELWCILPRELPPHSKISCVSTLLTATIRPYRLRCFDEWTATKGVRTESEGVTAIANGRTDCAA